MTEENARANEAIQRHQRSEQLLREAKESAERENSRLRREAEQVSMPTSIVFPHSLRLIKGIFSASKATTH